MDNITDRLLPNLPHAHRPPLGKDEKFLPASIAEHGFSALIETEVNNNNAESDSIQRNTHTSLRQERAKMVSSLILTYLELTSKTLMSLY
jgi:hypothetical protein